jgi:hypothetical protein
VIVRPGDSAADIGYGNPEELAKWEPDYWVSDLRELAS